MKFDKKGKTWIIVPILLLLMGVCLSPFTTSTTEAQLTQNQPPTITIIKPEEKGLYFRDIRFFPAVRTLIFGYITIKANAADDKGIKQVEFYIDGELRNTSISVHHCGSYMWIWNERTWIRSHHTIKVVAIDNESLMAEDTCDVFLHNFPLFHPLFP
jgi:hypothetical protein